MTISRVLAQATVSDLDRAQRWYATLFDREPDAHPMEGLLEWHLGEGFGVQVFSEPDRAGRSAMVLVEGELDRLAARLTAAGVDHPGVEPVTSSRVLRLEDPDGNRIVVSD